MKNLIPKKIDSLPKYIFYLVLALLLFFLSYKVFNHFTVSRSEKNISNIIEKILDVNKESSEFMVINDIDVEKALKSIPIMKENMYKIVESIDYSNKNLSDNDKKVYSHIYKGTQQNLLIFDQLIAILNNPTGKDILIACDDLKAYVENANNHYANLIVQNKPFSIGQPLSKFIDGSINYCINKLNSKKNEEIKENQLSKFGVSFNELQISFQRIKINFYSKALDCRNNKISYELVIRDINDTITKVDIIKKLLKEMSIPNNVLYIYEGLLNTVDTYSEYLIDIKYAMATEKVLVDKKDKSKVDLDSLYNTANNTYNNVDILYDKFMKEYVLIKDKLQ